MDDEKEVEVENEETETPKDEDTQYKAIDDFVASLDEDEKTYLKKCLADSESSKEPTFDDFRNRMEA